MIMSFIVGTNVVASQPPERRQTRTPRACAKKIYQINWQYYNKIKTTNKCMNKTGLKFCTTLHTTSEGTQIESQVQFKIENVCSSSNQHNSNYYSLLEF